VKVSLFEGSRNLFLAYALPCAPLRSPAVSLIKIELKTDRKSRCPRDPYVPSIFNRNLITHELVRTCWASSIAYAGNVQGRLESLQVWIIRICKPRHPLINAMFRRYRFLNRTFFYFDALVGYRCFFFCGYCFLNKLFYFRKHLQSTISPNSTLFMP